MENKKINHQQASTIKVITNTGVCSMELYTPFFKSLFLDKLYIYMYREVHINYIPLFSNCLLTYYFSIKLLYYFISFSFI